MPRVEVAVTRPSRGVIDLVLHDSTGADVVAAEVQGQLRRAELQVRWAGMKADALPSARDWPWGARAAPRIRRLLVLRSTEASQTIVGSLPEIFRAAYPAPEAAAHRTLTGEAGAWPGDALLWADVDAERTRIRRRRPAASGVSPVCADHVGTDA